MRNRLPDVAFAVLCAVSFVGFLWLGSNLTFYADEWGMILGADDWSLDHLLQPQNEHLVLGWRLMWYSLMATVGLESYLPYLVWALVFHVAIAVGVYVYGRRQGHALIALGTAAVFLFLGSGINNLSMAANFSWNAAAAAGTWALVILLRDPGPRRVWVAALLLLLGVVTFGSIGLLFVAASGAVLILSPRRRRHLWVVLPALVVYGLWFLTYGQDVVRSVPSIGAIQRFVVNGIAHATGQVSGLGAEVGLVIAVLLAVAALANLVRGERLRLGLIAGSVGLLCQWLLIAIARAAANPASYPATRYVYTSAILILIAVIGYLAYRRWLRRGSGLPFLVGIAAIVAVALVWNVYQIRVQDRHLQERADNHRAAMLLSSEYGGTPAFPLDRPFTFGARNMLRPAEPGEPWRIPATPRLLELFEQYGSPLDDPLAIRGVEISDEAIDDLFAQSVVGSVSVAAGELPDEPGPIAVEASNGVTTSEVAGCLAVEADGMAPRVDLAVPSGSSLAVWPESDGAGQVSVSLRGTFPATGPSLDLVAGEVTHIGLPDIGPDETVRVRLDLPAEGSALLCSEAP